MLGPAHEISGVLLSFLLRAGSGARGRVRPSSPRSPLGLRGFAPACGSPFTGHGDPVPTRATSAPRDLLSQHRRLGSAQAGGGGRFGGGGIRGLKRVCDGGKSPGSGVRLCLLALGPLPTSRETSGSSVPSTVKLGS